MKNLWEKFNEKRLKAFTLLEMLVVLLIIGVLILLFVPNLTKQKENINNRVIKQLKKLLRRRWNCISWIQKKCNTTGIVNE